MNAKVKREWIAALESGKYNKGECALRSIDDKFCCLGVLCDITNPNLWLPVEPIHGNAIPYAAPEVTGFLPRFIAINARLTDKEQNELTQLNDSMSDGKGFTVVVEYIKSLPED